MPAILEYLPYRKRDGTIERDALTHPYFAGHGYACVRVDMRGIGRFRRPDARRISASRSRTTRSRCIAWLAAQPWCSGTVGMIGISWGGFNGLQVAARRPPALKAIITLCSTDDRYADDIHYKGGCLLNENFAWGSTMFAIIAHAARPGAGRRQRWRDMWLERLENEPLLAGRMARSISVATPSGSMARSARTCRHRVPRSTLVGGWADGYTNAISRMLAAPEGAAEGHRSGPWAHKYPHFAVPGPQIGFLQECAALVGPLAEGHRDRHHGRADAARLDAGPASDRPTYAETAGPLGRPRRTGRARASQPLLGRSPPGALARAGSQPAEEQLSICSPQTIGAAAGK